MAKKNVNATASSLMTDQELSIAMERVLVHRNRLFDLHNQWKMTMVRMSFLVAFVALHQIQRPIKECIEEIKQAAAIDNRNDKGGRIMLRLNELVVTVVHCNACELLNVALALALVVFLLKFKKTNEVAVAKKDDLSGFVKALAALSSLLTGLYFNTDKVSCASESRDVEGNKTLMLKERDFPVVIIFFVAIMGAYYFILWGMEKAEKNVKIVQEFRAQLENAFSKSSSSSSLKKKTALKAKK